MEKPIETPIFTDSIPRHWVDATYAMHTREVESLDRHVYKVVRHKAIAQKYFPTVPIKKGMRYHSLSVAQEIREPIFTDDFLTEDTDKATKAEVTYWLAAMHKDYRLGMIDIDASQNNDYYDTDITTLNIREATLSVADYKERVLWRGYAIAGTDKAVAISQGAIDGNVKGIRNPPTAAGTTNAFTCAGDGTGIGNAGDGPLSVGAAMASVIDDEYFGPYVFIMTPGVYGALANRFNSTTHISDIERMQSMIDLKGTKILEALDVTRYLTVATDLTTTGAMLMFQRKTPDGEPTCVILESYAVAHYPTQFSSLGIKGKVLWMGGAANLRPKAFTEETAINYTA